jgi:5-methylcytosine-specific restriction endonuclease McrA
VTKKTLVLSSWYFPHRIVSWESAVTLVFLEKAQVVVEYDEEVRSPSTTIRVPAVIRLMRPVRVTKTSPKLTRGNLYLRDRYRCVYCNERLPARELTYDHVIPRAQGGRTEWENVVTACRACNHRKGNRTPDQAGMYPRCQAVRPHVLPLEPPRIDPLQAPAEWRAFCATGMTEA